MNRLKLLLVAGFSLVFWNSCQVGENFAGINDSLIDQEVTSENLLTELDAVTDEAVDLQLLLKSAETGLNFLTGTCPLKTFDQTSNPKVLTLDFGTGCKGADGKMRSGKIVIKAGSFEDQTSTRTKVFDNFFVEGKKVEGTITKTIVVSSGDPSRIAKITEDITVTLPDGKVASRKGNLTRKYVMGVMADRSDNKMISWGEMVSTHRGGVVFKKSVPENTPLVFVPSCRQIVSGKVTFTVGSDRTWSIDYGKGECDNTAIVTRGTEVRTIKLR